MPRVQPKSLSKSELNEFLNDFWIMVAALKTKEEAKNFFNDLLSSTEALMLARRIRIAKMLLKDMSYGEIAQKMRTGENTIAGVHRWLQLGYGGYVKSLPQLEKKLEKRAKKKRRGREYQQPYSFEWLKKRYPLHFALFNLFDDKR